MKHRLLSLVLALFLLPFGAFAAEEPQAVRRDYTYFYLTISITDQTTGDYYAKTIDGGTIPGDEESPEALAIRRDLLRQADEYATGLLRPGTELADRATSADLKWAYTSTHTEENEAGGRTNYEDVYSSYYMIYSAAIVSDGTVWIDSVTISVDPDGLTVGNPIDPANVYPTAAALEENALYAFDRFAWTTSTQRDAAPFAGTVKENTDYYARIELSAKDRARFSESPTVLANGEPPAKVDRVDDRTLVLYVAYRLADSPADDPGQWDDGPEQNPFRDIAEDAYYCEPVLWAVQQGITAGTSEHAFSPLSPCTRAQVVTFLWRAAGKPDAVNGENPFTDVKAGAYYYDAVLWAAEQGITTGTSEHSFSPDATCTRGQVVTFLWRNAGSPNPSISDIPFVDVKESDYFSKAVLWALEKGVTKGTSETAFSPASQCQRAHVVTFLYRDLKAS